ncbi:MAG: hypothetical protein HZB14_09735 [Actinobacteria bacterium]|nr:hypothetical protein [Actinomycetota bacterium]
MNRATLISRVVFGLLVLSTFTAFFVAQRLKRTEPLVYAVQMKKYISPNGDDVRERGYLRFRLKEADVVSVEVIDRAQRVVRALADERELGPGPHRFYWNGRARADGRRAGDPVADGAYRVRISLRNAGRTFVPDKFFVVDTRPPLLVASVVGEHTVTALRGRPETVTVKLTGASPSRRAGIEVYAVRGERASARPVASFVATRGETSGEWNLTVGEFRRRDEDPCFGPLVTKGRPRPAPPGRYVFVARACDAAGNQGVSGGHVPPRRGDARRAGLTLRGFEVQPALTPVEPGRVLSLAVNPPPGGYRYRLRRAGGETVADGSDRGATLSLRVPPSAGEGLYTLSLSARRSPSGGGRRAIAPVVVGGRYTADDLLVVYPAIAWQAQNPVDTDGDGFADDFVHATRQQRIAVDRTLAGGHPPAGFASREAALQTFLDASPPSARTRVTTDFALAAAPDRALARSRAVVFAGDERWITPQLGLALKRFVRRGGRVAFFAPDAFRHTVRLSPGTISGPSQRAERDVFGESIDLMVTAAAPVVPFADQLGLLSGPTGQFTVFEESRSRARAAEILTSAGRRPGHPALIAYRLGDGLIVRVGASGWQSALAGDAGVRATTGRIFEELLK